MVDVVWFFYCDMGAFCSNCCFARRSGFVVMARLIQIGREASGEKWFRTNCHRHQQGQLWEQRFKRDYVRREQTLRMKKAFFLLKR